MDIERQRNIAFVGPHHAGKTTLVEAVLAHSGAIPRRGSIADGTTVTDHEPEDISHAQTTTAGFAHCTSGNVDLTIVDAPGFIDFFEETKLVVCGADAAVIVVEADPARVVQTKTLVDYLESRTMPHCFVINKLDRPGRRFRGHACCIAIALRTSRRCRAVAALHPRGSNRKEQRLQRVRRSRRHESLCVRRRGRERERDSRRRARTRAQCARRVARSDG